MFDDDEANDDDLLLMSCKNRGFTFVNPND